MKTCLAILLLVGLALTQPVCAQELRWKLQEGDKFQLQMKQQTNSLVSLASRKLPSTIDLQVNVSWDVQSAKEDEFVIEQTIDSIRIEMKGPQQQLVQYDSSEKKAVVGAAKDLQTAVAPLVGRKFTLTMNAFGAIKSAKPVAPPAGDASPSSEAAATAGFSPETVEQLLSQPLLPLPENASGSQTSWTEERTTKAVLGEVTLKRTFTLAGKEDRGGQPTEKITIQGELTLTPPAETPKNAPKLKEQRHSGAAWFSKEAGRLVAIESTQRLVTQSMYRDSAITVDLTTTINTTLTPRP
jgi:hypothetical protein